MFYVLQVIRKRGSVDIYYRENRESILELERIIHNAYPNATMNKYTADSWVNFNYKSFN
ncbi:MAG: hypothetical protein MJ222_01965 [Bacilli bacterium]|nr:hypothetical protein [Bacilli bacterium]